MTVKVNEGLLRGYMDAIRSIAKEYDLPDELSALAVSRFPDVLSVEKKDLDAEAISTGIIEITEQALQDFDAMRLREGEKLRDDVLNRVAVIDSLVSTVEQAAPQSAVQQKIRQLHPTRTDRTQTRRNQEQRRMGRMRVPLTAPAAQVQLLQARQTATRQPGQQQTIRKLWMEPRQAQR